MTTTTHTPRRVLTQDEYQALIPGMIHGVDAEYAQQIGADAVAAVAYWTLAAVGVLLPPPEVDPDTCTAMCPDDDGEWWQCTKRPGHERQWDEHHQAADGFGWYGTHPDAIPPTADGSGSPVGARENGGAQ